MKLTNNVKLMWLLVLANLVLAVGYYFVFGLVRGQNDHSFALSQEVAAEEGRADLIRSMKSVVNKTSSDVNKLDFYFIPKDGVVAFIESVEQLGRQVGVSVYVDSIEVVGLPQNSKADATNNTVEVLKLEVTVTGSWSSVYWFLESMYAMPLALSIESADLSVFGSASTPAQSGAKVPQGKVGDWKGVFVFTILKIK